MLGASALTACTPGASTRCNVRMRHYFRDGNAPAEARSVMQLVWRERFADSGMGAQFSTGIDAEAAFIKFDALGTVFVPLRSAAESNKYPTAVLLDLLIKFGELNNPERAEAVRKIPTLREEVDVPREEWPLLILFTDIQDPASATELDPTDLFPGSGRKVTLERTTLQIVDAPVSNEINGQLPWLATLRSTLSGSKLLRPTGPAADRLSQIHFNTRE